MFNGIGIEELKKLEKEASCLFMPLYLTNDKEKPYSHGPTLDNPIIGVFETANRFIIRVMKST